ncbi:MAG: FHA domain-containing protein [Verrucomicrobiia bacterium]
MQTGATFPFKEVLQHFSQTGRTGQFCVRQGSEAGEIFLANGMAVFTATPSQLGEAAFLEILSWPSVTYTWVDGQRAPSVNMTQSVEDLLVQHIIEESKPKTNPNSPTATSPLKPVLTNRNSNTETRSIAQNNFYIVSLDIASTELAPFTYVIKSNQVRVGREPDNDLPLPDTSCSRRHALLVVAQDSLLIRDLGSKNGCFIDGQPVTSGIAKNGQIISFGEVNCRVQVTVVPRGNSASVPAPTKS